MRKKHLAVIAMLSLILAACGGDSVGETTTLQSNGLTTTTAGSNATTTAAETTTTTLAAASGGDDCLVGTWVLDDQAFFEILSEEFSGEEGFGELTVADGDFTAVFNADGTIDSERDDWGFSVVTDDGTFKIRINGNQSGTWAAEGSTLMLVLDGGSGFETTTSIEVDGQEVVLPTSPISVPSEFLTTSGEFTCSGNTLTVVSDGFTSTFNRG